MLDSHAHSTWRTRLHGRLRDERGSAAVEYVGLAVVISMLMTAAATAIDSSLGERLVTAIVARLSDVIEHVG